MKLGIGMTSALRRRVHKESYKEGGSGSNGYASVLYFKGLPPAASEVKTHFSNMDSIGVPVSEATKYVGARGLFEARKLDFLGNTTYFGSLPDYDFEENEVELGMSNAGSIMFSPASGHQESCLISNEGTASWFLLAITSYVRANPFSLSSNPFEYSPMVVTAFVGTVGLPGSGKDIELQTLDLSPDEENRVYPVLSDFKLSLGTAYAQMAKGSEIGLTEPVSGTQLDGFFGEIPEAQFITTEKLQELTGLVGEVTEEEHAWLKVKKYGKTLYIAKVPILNTISWVSLQKANSVSGNKRLKIQGRTYKLRIFLSEVEWREIMHPLAGQSSILPEGFPYQANYTSGDLLGASTIYSWISTAVTVSVYGVGGVNLNSFNSNYAPSTATTMFGWRPVLELID